MRWDKEEDGFFLSHAQLSGGQTARMLSQQLEMAGQDVWIDVNEDPSKANMQSGIRRFRTFLLLLTKVCRDDVARIRIYNQEVTWSDDQIFLLSWPYVNHY